MYENLPVVGSAYFINTYKGWDNGQLEEKDVFDKNDALLMTTEYDYDYHYKDTIQNTHVTQICYYPGDDGDDSTRRECLKYQIDYMQLNFNLPSVYGYYNYNIVTGRMEKTSETETYYFNGTPVTKTTSYEYNGARKYYPSDITQTNSDGSNTIIKKKYPYDLSSTSPYTTMVSRNIISPTIVTKEFHNNNFLRADSTADSLWHTSFFKPLAEYTRTVGQTGYERRLKYNDYDDKGNILSISKEDDIKYSYIWGYNQSYPIAEIMNSSDTNVFYTSFEETDGNSNNGDSYTGKLSRTNGFSKYLSDLSVGQYILSYSKKNGNNWDLEVDTVIVTNGQYTINISGQVDEVRFYPINARMTTYTYKPLVGMTSKTDQNNITTYYEYDLIGRLEYIRDNNRKILKHIEYHYSSSGGN
jgi:hypothetical protein